MAVHPSLQREPSFNGRAVILSGVVGFNPKHLGLEVTGFCAVVKCTAFSHALHNKSPLSR